MIVLTTPPRAYLEARVLCPAAQSPELPQQSQQVWQEAPYVLSHHHDQHHQLVKQQLTQRLITHTQHSKQHRQDLHTARIGRMSKNAEEGGGAH
jgi:hypothetical protein